jgi:hypothetical protein
VVGEAKEETICEVKEGKKDANANAIDVDVDGGQ